MKIPQAKILGIISTLMHFVLIGVLYYLFIPFGYLRFVFIIVIGILGICSLKKLFDSKSGLEIDSLGITDYSDIFNIGLIEWKNVSKVRFKKEGFQKFILIDIFESEKYLKGNIFKIVKIRKNSISINYMNLNYDYLELEKVIKSEFEKRKTQGNTV